MTLKLNDVFYGNVLRLELVKLDNGILLEFMYVYSKEDKHFTEVHISNNPENVEWFNNQICGWLNGGSFINMDFIKSEEQRYMESQNE